MTTKPMMLPPDISPNWLNVIRRIKSVALGQPTLITIDVFVDEYGNPRVWTKPIANKLEPYLSAIEGMNEIEAVTLRQNDTANDCDQSE